ncbi:MAG: amino acid adenylation domain-containing protein [Candidatus Sulfotelmatobacter sp.]
MMSNSVSLADKQHHKELKYWLQKLSGEPVVTGISLDFKRPPTTNSERRTCEIVIDLETQSRLRKASAGDEILTFTACVAALKICLYHYTHSEDVIIGTAIHQGYRELTLDNKILVLRDHVSGSHTVRNVMDQVLHTVTEAYAHQKYSFKQLLRHLQVEMQPNRAPLFNVVALFENINRCEDAEGLLNDVTMIFAAREDSLSGVIEYSTELFKDETISVFARHFETILGEMITQPDARVSELQLLSKRKRNELVVDFNDTARAFLGEQTVAQLFEAQAERSPNSSAVVFEGRTLTYQELNHRANQLAHTLLSLDAGPGTLVGIYLEHSLETMIALLGVLKAGAAYVPLDPQHPPSRTAFMLSNGAISIVLTQQTLVDRIRDQVSIAICLDRAWDDSISVESIETPPYQTNPGDLAYVIYTSGSTGTPKGVEISHAALSNYVLWARETYLRGDNLDFALYSSLAFDLTVTSLYVPLISGQRVLVYRPKQGESSLSAVLDDNQAEILKLTPSHLALVKDRDNNKSRVRRLIVGGEALDTNLALQVQNSFGYAVEIYNEYGPTEATVGCMVHLFDPPQDARAVVPIGKPAANMQIFLLDENLNPVPENVMGELYISGVGLARGFLNNQQQTAERFINNPILPGRKMYKTGDVARWLPAGILEYIGRNDEQVKFHGYRIELNEIRSLLNRYPEIKDNIVLVLKDNNGNDLLVAYYVSNDRLDPAVLRATLARNLVEETIPNFFVHLDKFPLTGNGKIDRRALPSIEEVRRQIKPALVAPRTPTEKFIAEIWAQVLGIPSVGIYDNFFELGGHSLLAYQVISRIGEAYQVAIPMRSIFDAPTIANLALSVTKMQMEQEDIEDAAQMIEEIKLMSGDELENMLAAEGRQNSEDPTA